ncbi:hypothetical protein OS493_004448 [Desmophyllum pertusum]|uniref:Uncharacterized protein n=1 Tax=Desmophyllum pertusum TaxID=174260 RepID=A0A9X0CZ34_9CNID|nr:hypothetical protein OS493_004448 [Desmophyllum pertusum]
MFQHLHLSEEEKLRYFVQGLRPDIRREVLIKQPHTYREAEDAARLMQMVDSTVRSHDSTLTPINDKIIDAVVKATIAAQGSARGHPEKKIAAYDFAPMPSEAEQLASLQQQVRQLTILISGPQSIAAYQSNAPRESSYNRDNKDNEVARLKEEIRQLKATVQVLQSTRGGQPDSYARNNPPQEVNSDLSSVLEEIRRMQSHSSKVQNHWQSQTVQHNREIVEAQPQVAAYEHVQEAPSRNQPSYDYTNLARRSQPLPSSSTSASTEVPTINTIDAGTIYRPTKRKDIEEMDPDAISKRHTRDAPIRAHSANDKQEIVVRIEICTDNKTSNSKNVTLMPNPEENIGK